MFNRSLKLWLIYRAVWTVGLVEYSLRAVWAKLHARPIR